MVACGDSGPAATAPKPQIVGKDAALPNVAVVTTCGPIAGRIAPRTGGAVPSVSGADLVAAAPGLEKPANIAVLSFRNIDSSRITPRTWANLSATVAEVHEMPNLRGVVVTHGADTMEEGACLLELTLPGDKPVVFTRAMNNASSPFPDGPGNLQAERVGEPGEQSSAGARGQARHVADDFHVRKGRSSVHPHGDPPERGLRVLTTRIVPAREDSGSPIGAAVGVLVKNPGRQGSCSLHNTGREPTLHCASGHVAHRWWCHADCASRSRGVRETAAVLGWYCARSPGHVRRTSRRISLPPLD